MKENLDERLFEELAHIYHQATGQKLPEPVTYKAGTDLFVQGEVPKGVYYIKEGVIKIARNNHESPVAVRLAKKHDLVGYLSLLKHWDYDSTATAVEKSVVYFIPKEFFLQALDTNIKFANLVITILCNHMHSKNELLTDLLTKGAGQRLAILLLMFDHEPYNGKINVLKKDIASILNIKAETLSRNLLKLQKLGAIKLHVPTNSIEILSRQKLLQLTDMKD